MDETEQLRLIGRLATLKRRLMQTTDAAVTTIISDDIANLETQLRAGLSTLCSSGDDSSPKRDPGAR